MHIILLALGLVIGVAGIALIGFGVRGVALSDGDTLVIAGTVALVGSLALIGLASAIRQLRRIAQLLETRPLPRALGAEPAETAPRIPAVAPVLPPEPRLDRPAERPAPPESKIVPVETPPAAADDVPELAPAASVDAAPVDEPPAEPSPPTAPVPRRSFAALWPGETTPAPAAPRETYSVATTVIETASVEQDAIEPAAPGPQAQIFKSGVIDGMAYTLYTDGSIEAELAEGTVKFASIDELRVPGVARV